jgi:hypothetical protein
MTTHQQDSSQPQQSHDSPHLGAGVGLMMEVMEEAAEPGIVMVVVGIDAMRELAVSVVAGLVSF